MNDGINFWAVIQYATSLGLVAIVGAVVRTHVMIGRHDERLKALERDVKDADEKASAALYHRGRRVMRGAPR